MQKLYKKEKEKKRIVQMQELFQTVKNAIPKMKQK